MIDSTELPLKESHHPRSTVTPAAVRMPRTPIYFLGFLIFIGGLAWAAFTIGVPPTWIAIGCTILAGIALMSTVSHSTTTSTTVVPRETTRHERVVVEG